MSERMMLRGRLADLKMKYREAKTLADGYIISLRGLVNPYDEIESLRIDLIRAQVAELHKAWERCRSLKEEIARIEEELTG
jgi:hypothetical protein